MNTTELAELLDGRPMDAEISAEEENIAKENNLLVVFGYSDDNMELRGFESDEVGCYEGGTCRVDKHGLRTPWPDSDDEPLTEDEAREYFARKDLPSIEITALWWDDSKAFAWTYTTDAQVVDRFAIMEGEERFCEGLVIDCSELTKEKTNV